MISVSGTSISHLTESEPKLTRYAFGARALARWKRSLHLCMSTLFSKEGDPGKRWKLTRGAGGIRLWVPPTGKHKKQYNFDRLPADLAGAIGKIIDIDADKVPHELLDALRSSGEILQ